MMREILSEPDFITAALPPRQRVLAWIQARLNDAWEWLNAQVVDDTGGVLQVLAILVPLAALMALGVVAFRHAPAWLGAGSRRDEEAAAARRTPRSAPEWLRLARRRAGEGAFRPAATALYQGFLLTLDQGERVAYHPSKTPGDYALEIEGQRREGKAKAGDGGRFLRSFQRLAFREETPSREAYADLEALARAAGCAEPVGADAPAGAAPDESAGP